MACCYSQSLQQISQYQFWLNATFVESPTISSLFLTFATPPPPFQFTFDSPIAVASISTSVTPEPANCRIVDSGNTTQWQCISSNETLSFKINTSSADASVPSFTAIQARISALPDDTFIECIATNETRECAALIASAAPPTPGQHATYASPTVSPSLIAVIAGVAAISVGVIIGGVILFTSRRRKLTTFPSPHDIPITQHPQTYHHNLRTSFISTDDLLYNPNVPSSPTVVLPHSNARVPFAPDCSHLDSPVSMFLNSVPTHIDTVPIRPSFPARQGNIGIARPPPARLGTQIRGTVNPLSYARLKKEVSQKTRRDDLESVSTSKDTDSAMVGHGIMNTGGGMALSAGFRDDDDDEVPLSLFR